MKAVLNQNDRAKSILSAFESDFKEMHGNDRKTRTGRTRAVKRHLLKLYNLPNSSNFATIFA